MDMKDQKLATEIAEERMTLIAPLLSQNLDKDSVRLIRSEICERNQISPRTLERYLSSYLRGGFEALKPQSKSAEYKYKIPQELLDEAIQLRRELPSRSIPTIIKNPGAGGESGARLSKEDHFAGCPEQGRVFCGHDEPLQRQGLCFPTLPAYSPARFMAGGH